ncbi:uncharacterized protein CDAR_83351 [Caerostris darwini]|uniref:Uncharacterized protein n=1 Tax=Caerostris darwini TaxID=1538125 RepID=A0AAV4VKW1_9ARAC|nr:uncharacterized protein CDAR_83351 [Caerostris darwini]
MDYLRNQLFCEDLMIEVLKSVGRTWEPEQGLTQIRSELDSSPFEKQIGKAVFLLIKKFVDDVNDRYQEFLSIGAMESDEIFAKYAIREALLYFDKGYTHASFLSYCAIVIGVAVMDVTLPGKYTLDRAAQVIALVLSSHQLSGQFWKVGGWYGIQQSSAVLVEKMRDVEQVTRL